MPLTEPTKLVLKKDSVAATDVNIREVSLLLHGNGANGSTTIVDSSLNPKTVTPVGNAQISTAIADPFGNNTGVLAFDGSADSLTCTLSSAIGSSDFAVEGWVRIASFATSRPLCCLGDDFQSSGILFYITTAGRVGAFGGNGAFNLVGTTQTVSLNTWTHIAMTRSGTSLRLFVDGVHDGMATNSQNLSNAVTQIGREIYNNNSGVVMNGYIDDLRITKGVARYTSNFTPPTAPFPDF